MGTPGGNPCGEPRSSAVRISGRNSRKMLPVTSTLGIGHASATGVFCLISETESECKAWSWET